MARALRVAHDLGVREVDVLLLRGPPLSVPPSAPAEAAMVLPSDLSYRELRLVTEPGAPRATPGRSFGSLVVRLARDPRLDVADRE